MLVMIHCEHGQKSGIGGGVVSIKCCNKVDPELTLNPVEFE